MYLTRLRQFLMVGERGSLSQAAKALNISQPGLTRSMHRLEGELDAPLLLRRPRGVELAEAGVALQRQANAVQMQLADAAQEVVALSHHQPGHSGRHHESLHWHRKAQQGHPVCCG